MGTRTQAATARKRPKAPAAPPPPSPDMLQAMQTLASHVTRPDGSIDAVAVLTATHGILGDERYASFEMELMDYFAPQGLTEVFVATWNYGWEGKLQTLCGLVGAAAVLIGVCEVAGRVADIPGLQFGTKLCNWIIGA